MSVNKTSICNMALSRIGQRQLIANIDEKSESASLCKLFYDQCLESILTECDWPFAQRYQTLALVTEYPNVKWRYAYRYPTGYLSIVSLHQSISGDVTYLPSNAYILSNINLRDSRSPNPFTISSDNAGRLILTDLANAIALGSYFITDEAQFDALFANALSWKIASEIAISLSKDASIKNLCLSEYEKALSKAFARASEEEGRDEEPESGFITARY